MIPWHRDLTCLVAGAILVVAVAAPVRGDIIGRASVIDGDTIEIRGERIRLFGIDSPKSTQLCSIDGQPYRCGQRSALALADKIGEQPVRCEERDVDRYGRTVAVCYVGDEDVGRWMVERGWAMPFRKYSRSYVDAEDEAREAIRGIWQDEFEMPWDWRAARRNH